MQHGFQPGGTHDGGNHHVNIGTGSQRFHGLGTEFHPDATGS
jgi:hypothetical protein